MKPSLFSIIMRDRIIVGLAVACTLLYGCDKSDEIQYDVIFTDLIPAIELNYLKSVIVTNESYTHPCYNYEAVPSDTSIIYSLDIDKDNENDFLFELSLASYLDEGILGGFCGSYKTFATTVTIKSLDDKDSIFVYHTSPMTNFFHSYGDSIQNNLSNAMWTTEWDFYLNGTLAQYEYDDIYIMVKKRNNFGWINISSDDEIGYNCTFIIKGYAISLLENDPIFAGQEE